MDYYKKIQEHEDYRFYFVGGIDLKQEVIDKLIDHHKNKDRWLLNEYIKIRQFLIDAKVDALQEISLADKNEILRCHRRVDVLDLFKDEDIYLIYDYADSCYNNFLITKKREDNRDRIDAQKFISNKKIRRKVFSIHGDLCLRCGGSEFISIDHVKPISKGGENKIENLQPLCRSCNSWKGVKTIDYRKKNG